MENLKYKRYSKNNGITLIALVITIIVLLILAAVSISTLTGENGLLTKAGQAKENTIIGQEKEQVELAYNSAITEKTGDKVTKKDLQKELDNIAGVGNTSVYINDGFLVEYTNTNRKYYINQNGEIEIDNETNTDISDESLNSFEGSGTKLDPYIVMSIEDLMFLSKDSQEGNDYSNTYFKLGRNLNFKSELSYCNYSTKEYNDFLGITDDIGLLEALTNDTYSGFKPIGYLKDSPFYGIFDGNGKTISGIYIKSKKNFCGIFGNSSTIKNLTVKNGYVEGGNATGAIVGAVRSGELENCVNESVTVVLTNGEYSEVGGIAGQVNGNRIERCNNYADVIARRKNA